MQSCVLSILILCLSWEYVQPTDVEEEHPFDLLIFTQFWPITICQEWKEENPRHSCALPAKQGSWSIHGIWPTKLGTKEPSFCNRTWLFDPVEIGPIEKDMIAMWPNIQVETSTYSLWAHEWNKHGTCAAVLPPLSSQFKYFSQGLSWMKKFMMHDILKEASIIPSDNKEYKIEDIHHAIVSKLGVRPAIECDKEHGRNYISEIRICFNKTLELTDCDGIAYPTMQFNSILTNCNPNSGIYYIQNPEPHKLYVQLYKLVSWLQWLTL